MHVSLHGVMVYAVFVHLIADEWVILVYSFVVNLVFLILYSSSFDQSSHLIFRRMRWFVIYWESAISLLLRAGLAA